MPSDHAVHTARQRSAELGVRLLRQIDELVDPITWACLVGAVDGHASDCKICQADAAASVL